MAPWPFAFQSWARVAYWAAIAARSLQRLENCEENVAPGQHEPFDITT
jgi:hypothetical protein